MLLVHVQIVAAGIFAGSVWDFCGIRLSALLVPNKRNSHTFLSEALFLEFSVRNRQNQFL